MANPYTTPLPGGEVLGSMPRPGPGGFGAPPAGLGQPPDPDLLRSGLRRYRRRGRVCLLVTLALVAIGALLIAWGYGRQPDAPTGGKVVDGDVVDVVAYGDVWVVQVEPTTSYDVAQVIVEDRPDVSEGDRVWAAVDADGRSDGIVHQPEVALAVAAVLIILGPLALLVQIPAAVGRLQVSLQLRRNQLALVQARVVPATKADRPVSTYAVIGVAFGAIGALLAAGLLRSSGTVGGVLVTEHPIATRSVVGKKHLSEVRRGPVYLPLGKARPIAALTSAGTVVPLTKSPGRAR